MKQRRVPELMDGPDISPASHHRALAGLQTINYWSNSVGIVWRQIEPLFPLDRPLRILDVATGAGDVPIGLWHRAKSNNVPVEIEACDKSVIAVSHARDNAAKHSAAIRFFQCDVLTDDLGKSYDVIVSSLFMHHLDSGQAVGFLKKLAANTQRRLIINDLRRSAFGWVMALSAGTILRSRVVRVDGIRSVRAAYTMREAADIAVQAGLDTVLVEPQYPFRFVMMWSRK